MPRKAPTNPTESTGWSLQDTGGAVRRLAQLGALFAALSLGGCAAPPSGSVTGDEASGGGGSGGSPSEPLAACPGAVVPSGTTCRQHEDCGDLESCQAAPFSPGCEDGGCIPPISECTSDGECGDGSICLPTPQIPCECSEGTACVPACNGDSCGEGFVCEDDGRCQVASCEGDGYACPVDRLCSPGRAGDEHGCAPRFCDGEGYECPEGTSCDPIAGSDGHGCRAPDCTEGAACPPNHDCDSKATSPTGCARRACTADADCDCGGCVLGRCEDHFFVCTG